MTWTVGREAMYDESLQALVGSCIQARWASVWFMSMTIKITPVRFTMGKFFFQCITLAFMKCSHGEMMEEWFTNLVLLRAQHCQTEYRDHLALYYARNNMSKTLWYSEAVTRHQPP